MKEFTFSQQTKQSKHQDSTEAKSRHQTSKLPRLTVPVQLQSVVSLPGLAPPSSGLVVPVSLAQPAVPLTRGSQSPKLTVFVDRLDYPVDSGVAADRFVLWVDKDHLKIFVCSILVDPVGVCFSSVAGMVDADGWGDSLSTRKFAQRLPTRSSATERRDLWNLSWFTLCVHLSASQFTIVLFLLWPPRFACTTQHISIKAYQRVRVEQTLEPGVRNM